MNRTNKRPAIFQVNAGEGERLKAMEKVLSNEIDQNVRVLRLFHPFNDALQAVYAKDMFVKANPKAMTHVVHYLLMIYSPPMFRKKFRWPITNKADESHFRQAALTYFNELRSQFNWDIGPLKMQLILFPGGVEFMKLIQLVSNLAMGVVLKRSTSATTHSPLTLGAAQQKLTDLQKLYENTQIYCQKLSATTQLVGTKVAQLKQMWHDITSGMALEQLQEADTSLARVSDKWDRMQYQEIKYDVKPMMAYVSQFISTQKSCVDNIELIFNARKITYDPMRLQDFVDRAKQLFYEKHTKLFDEIVVDQKIELDNLLVCFAPLVSHIVTERFQMESLNANRLAPKNHLLLALSRKLDGMVMRFKSTECEYNDVNHFPANPVDELQAAGSVEQFSNLTARIKSMLINTPPIVEAKLRQTNVPKRQRIFCTDLVDPAVDCYDLGRGIRNLSLSSVCEEDDDVFPASKRFRTSESALQTLACASVVANQTKQATKTSAMKIMKSIQMRRGVNAFKSSRQTVNPKSSVTPDCPSERIKALETLQLTPKTPRTINESSTFSMERNGAVCGTNVAKKSHSRKRLSLDGDI